MINHNKRMKYRCLCFTILYFKSLISTDLLLLIIDFELATSVQPSRYAWRIYLFASGTFVNFTSSGRRNIVSIPSHTNDWPMRSATLPSKTTSVNGPETSKLAPAGSPPLQALIHSLMMARRARKNSRRSAVFFALRLRYQPVAQHLALVADEQVVVGVTEAQALGELIWTGGHQDRHRTRSA